MFGAYTDSLPMVVISGQVRRETIAGNFPIGLRQLGDQEVDIVRMVGGITKSAVTLQDASRIRYEIEKACHLAVSGRPGPTWVDVPIDIQGASINPDTLVGFDAREDGSSVTPVTEANPLVGEALRVQARGVIGRFRQSRRPCLLPGTGVRIAGCADLFSRVAARLGAPVATAFNAHDLVANDDPLYAGSRGHRRRPRGEFRGAEFRCAVDPGLPPEYPPDQL